MAKLVKSAVTKLKPKIKSEHKEQAVFMSTLSFEHPTVLAFANPNGAKRGAWEAAQKKAEGLIAGIPDVTVAEARGGWFGLYMEFKRSDQMRAVNGGLSEEQLKIHPRLRARGYKVVTVYSAAMALQRFREYMALPLTVASLASFAVVAP